MPKKSPLEQLRKIRNLRAENLSWQLAEARGAIARLAEERKREGAEFEAVQARVDQASIGQNLAAGKFVSGAEVHAIVQKQSKLRAMEAEAQDRGRALEEAVAAAERRADRLEDEVARARRIATRTDILSDMIKSLENE
ncbi:MULTISPECIES: hypothetical protein [unclassified Rhizobium]|uniref:hypothetical protein n=1 Tax=unclassified Rhizobium TaxID=2613769 RepID=UPI000BE828F6|nr:MULTISPECIES: hypothetical protein [unclassified Rhizobium]PDT06692.1 hypothetical protein CO655_31360 [Rhizobium sp. M1]PDT34756.1 hypothetical protein CO671_18770 [Rhizobium sp. M10]